MDKRELVSKGKDRKVQKRLVRTLVRTLREPFKNYCHISESLVQIQHFRHECLSILYLPNTKAIDFCDIIFRHTAMFSKCPYKVPRKSKIEPRRQNKLLSYTLFLVNISGRYINWCRLQTCYRLQTIDRIPKLQIHRHFLEFSETCLYKKISYQQWA